MEEAELKRVVKKPKQTQSNTQYDHLLNGLFFFFTSFLKASCWYMVVVALGQFGFSFFFIDSTLDEKWNRNYLPELVCHI